MKTWLCELFGANRGCPGDNEGRIEVDAAPCVYDRFEYSNSVGGRIYVEDFQNFELLRASSVIGSIVVCFAVVGFCMMAVKLRAFDRFFPCHVMVVIIFVLGGFGVLIGSFILRSKVRYDSEIRCYQAQYTYERPPGFVNEGICASRFWCDGEELTRDNASVDKAALYLFMTAFALAVLAVISALFTFFAIGFRLFLNVDGDMFPNEGGIPFTQTEMQRVVRDEMPPA